ncbi:hypothetical protein LCI18_013006 [Fusarium solani-melongenae]|uniref:Uncharacterized protein n=1 Tax=Fusarium solani subsp. cucurbitae TaxID=2747967 RepID=A0ACD3ZLI4_FUSSC|nr:hypothetical protein LCI18_013006 [Fusarium solani-melongenae]
MTMVQCLLSIQNGSFRLEAPKQDRQSQDPPARDWIKSHLDDICLETFQTSPQLQPHHLSHGNFGRLPRKLRSQYRLVGQDGIVAVRNPRSWYSQLTGNRAVANVEPEHRDFRSPFFTLPVEIRLCIYRQLLTTKCLAVISPDPEGFRVLPQENYVEPFWLYPEILATCRQINREGTSILYLENGFRREFLWRRTWTKNGRKPFPRGESSPLKEANLQCISRVRIFRTYHQWFRDGSLKVLHDFPNLKELQVHIDDNDIWGELNPESHWKDSMRSINRLRPDLACVKTQIRLNFDQRYRDWCDRCRNKRLDFSVHRIKKDELERWIRSEGLFAGRDLVWSFSTQTSEYCGPSCIVALTIDRNHRGTDTIKCRIEGDLGTEYTTEPAYLDKEV